MNKTAGGLGEADFRHYIDAFNRNDFEGFSTYYAEDLDFHGRAGHFRGRQAVLDFYQGVKRRIRETLTLRQLIVGEQGIAADVVTELYPLEDWLDFPTGPLRKGETRRSENFLWYDVYRKKFTRIRAAHYGSGTDTVATVATASAASSSPQAPAMTPSRFAAYIDAFNRDDYAAFGDYYDENVRLVIAGRKELLGREAIFDYYRAVKAQTQRTIHINNIITAPGQLAAELQSEFLALRDLPDFLAGPMKKGERLFINTFALYELHNGRFAQIRSAGLRKFNSGT
jgi:ketosteroid isomerase-like protein